MKHVLVLVALGALLVACTSREEPFAITDEGLHAIVAEALPLVREETGAALADGVRIEVCDTAEIEAVLRDELLPQMAVFFGDEVDAAEQAAVEAASLAPAVLAKLRHRDQTVLVSRTAFPRLSRALEDPAPLTVGMLRAVVVHELVHAADEELHAYLARGEQCTTAEALHAYSCIIEGHAQLITRRIVRRLDWESGFEVFTRAVGALPPPARLERMLPATREGLEARVAAVRTAYHDGERFLAAVEEARGAAGIERVFRDPPTETALILEPGRYLEAENRPR